MTKFGPKFKKMFAAYPALDKTQIKHTRVFALTRPEMFYIIKVMKDAGVKTPTQPTRTSNGELRLFIFNELNKLSL